MSSAHHNRTSASVDGDGRASEGRRRRAPFARIHRTPASAAAARPRTCVMGGEGDAVAGAASASFGSTLLSVLANVVGAGLLSLPYSIRRCGLAVGVAVMIAIAAANGASMLLLAHSADMAGEYTYRGIAVAAMGPRTGTAIAATLALYTLGSCIAFAVLLADFVPALICMNGCDGGSHAVAATFAARHVVLFGAGALILYPLSLFRTLNALRYTSAASAVCIIYTTIMVVVKAAQAGPDAAANLRSTAGSAAGGVGVFVAMPIYLVAFALHYNVPKFYGEMAARSLRAFTGVTAAAFGIVTVLYMATAVGGYALFGAATQSDVLSNFSASDPAAIVARIALSIIVIACFPLAFNGLRGAVLQLLPATWRAAAERGVGRPAAAGGVGDRLLAADGSPGGDGDAAMVPVDGGGDVGGHATKGGYHLVPGSDGAGSAGQPSAERAGTCRARCATWWAAARADWPHALLTKLLVLLAVVVALLVPNIGTVLAYKGALAGSLIIYVFPVWMWFALHARSRKTNGSHVAGSGAAEAPAAEPATWQWSALWRTWRGWVVLAVTAFGFILMLCGTLTAAGAIGKTS